MESVGSIIMYVIIALSIILFSVLTVTTRKILRSATFLLFTLFAAALLYFKLDYEFLGAVQIAVYAGGIVVLFVFSILLTSHPGDKSERLVSRRRILGCAAALATFVAVGWAFLYRVGQYMAQMPAMTSPKIHKIGLALMGSGEYEYLLPFEALSVLLLACIIGGVVVARKR